jgi:hypothetical protein
MTFSTMGYIALDFVWPIFVLCCGFRLHIFEVAVQIGHMQPTYMNWATLKVGYLGKALNLGCAELSGQPWASSH